MIWQTVVFYKIYSLKFHYFYPLDYILQIPEVAVGTFCHPPLPVAGVRSKSRLIGFMIKVKLKKVYVSKCFRFFVTSNICPPPAFRMIKKYAHINSFLKNPKISNSNLLHPYITHILKVINHNLNIFKIVAASFYS